MYLIAIKYNCNVFDPNPDIYIIIKIQKLYNKTQNKKQKSNKKEYNRKGQYKGYNLTTKTNSIGTVYI